MADKIKVVGYAQRVFYDDGIEYRNFSDSLVGRQITDPNAIFTDGNFTITSNFDGKITKEFVTSSFGQFYSLDDLKVDNETYEIIKHRFSDVVLNLDASSLCYHAYFGSLVEFIRVSLEDIIMDWPASLYVSNINPTSINTGYTVENYSYDLVTNESKFIVPTGSIINKFEINYNQNGTIINTYNEGNNLRNLTVNYSNYVIFVNDETYPVIGFTGSTNDGKNYLNFKVQGNPFDSPFEIQPYHIRPSDVYVNRFFANLPPFESYLLNTFSNPLYTSEFEFKTQTDTGLIINTKQKFTWPVSDGYNIDYDTVDYIDYVQGLISMGEQSDGTKSDLINRFLVANSISDFDTIPDCDGEIEETAGQKMNKTLRIYGREYDEIKKHIDNIAFANVVTYDRKDNTPDVVLKNIARTLGWELVSSVLENDLLKDYLTPKTSEFSGLNRGLTPYEAEVELWRRLILNSAWIWKSKGTRKAIDFFLKFIGTPNGLITFNEYIYKAKKTLDIRLFKDVLLEIDGDTSIDGLNIDSEGFPLIQPNTTEMYFQKGGLWYRETAGENSNIDVLTGNNPHIGPYDGGQEYINQFYNLIPDFEPVVLDNDFVSTSEQNIFTNYNSGLINGSNSQVYAQLVTEDNTTTDDCYDFDGEIITDPKPTTELTDCGCETGGIDDAIRLNFTKKVKPPIDDTPSECGYSGFTLESEGYVLFQTPNGETTTISQTCCEALGFRYEELGDIKCYWNNELTSNQDPCLSFQPVGELPDGAISWSNGDVMTTVVSLNCCNAYGYDSKIVEGGYQCMEVEKECENADSVVVDENDNVSFIIDGEVVIKVSPECCTNNGFNTVTYEDGYRCIVSNTGVVQPNNPTTPSINDSIDFIDNTTFINGSVEGNGGGSGQTPILPSRTNLVKDTKLFNNSLLGGTKL